LDVAGEREGVRGSEEVRAGASCHFHPPHPFPLPHHPPPGRSLAAFGPWGGGRVGAPPPPETGTLCAPPSLPPPITFPLYGCSSPTSHRRKFSSLCRSLTCRTFPATFTHHREKSPCSHGLACSSPDLSPRRCSWSADRKARHVSRPRAWKSWARRP